MWRPEGIEEPNANSTIRTATQEQDDTYEEWRQRAVATNTYYTGGVNTKERQISRDEKRLLLSAEITSKWPLLRRTRVPPEANVPNDTGSDLKRIATPSSPATDMLPASEIKPENIEVVTFPTMQLNAPETDRQFLQSSEITGERLDEGNRWLKAGTQAMPWIWKLANLENQTQIKRVQEYNRRKDDGEPETTDGMQKLRQQIASMGLGVAYQFATQQRDNVAAYTQAKEQQLRQAEAFNAYQEAGGAVGAANRQMVFSQMCTQYTEWYESLASLSTDDAIKVFPQSAALPMWLTNEMVQVLGLPVAEDWDTASDAGQPIVYVPVPPDVNRPIPEAPSRPSPVSMAVPSVSPGSFWIGNQNNSRNWWEDVTLDDMRDPVLRCVMQMVTDNGDYLFSGQAEPGLDRFHHIAKRNADGQRSDKNNNLFIVPYALYEKGEYDAAAATDPEQQRLRDIEAQQRAANERRQAVLNEIRSRRKEEEARQGNTQEELEAALVAKFERQQAAKERIAQTRAAYTVERVYTLKVPFETPKENGLGYWPTRFVPAPSNTDTVTPAMIDQYYSQPHMRSQQDRRVGDANFDNAYQNAFLGRTVRDLTDDQWWALWNGCYFPSEAEGRELSLGLRRRVDWPPGKAGEPGYYRYLPTPNPDSSSNIFEEKLVGSQDGMRFESLDAYNDRLSAWENEPLEVSKLPWRPERHEAAYWMFAERTRNLLGDRIARLRQEAEPDREAIAELEQLEKGAEDEFDCYSGGISAVNGSTGLKGDRFLHQPESSDAHKRRLASWKRYKDDWKQARFDSQERLKQQFQREQRELENESDAMVDADAMFAEDPMDTGVHFGDDLKDRCDSDMSEQAMHAVHWAVLGGVGLGSSGAYDLLCLTVAGLPKERVAELASGFAAEERLALRALWNAGKRVLSEQMDGAR